MTVTRRRLLAVAMSQAALVTLASCGGNGTGLASGVTAAAGSPGAPVLDAALKGTLTGAGSTFDYPLFSSLFAEYHQLVPGVTVNYQSIGSGGGIQQFTQRTVDFGASDAPLNAEQEKALPSPGLHVPITIGAVSTGYNLPGLQGELKLSGEVLAGIYLGDITTWNDPRITTLNPGLSLPNTPVVVVHRSDGSGTTFIFTNYLSAVSSTWKGKVGASTSVSWPVGIGAKGSEGVAGQVRQVPGGIGYFELAYAKQNGITAALLQNKDGQFVAPSVAGASAAAAGAAANMPADLKVTFPNPAGADVYPIAGFSWVLVYQEQTDQAKGAILAHLLDWMVTDGQLLGPKLFYAPLPAPVVSLCRAQVRKMTYQGKGMLT